MKYRKTVLTFLAAAVVLSGTFSGFAQQLPEIIWDQVAQRPETGGLSTTNSIRFSRDGQRVFAGGSRIIGYQVGSITIFAAANGADLKATPTYFPIPAINELSVSIDEQRLATAHNGVACDIFQTNCRYAYILYDAQQLTRLSEPQTSFYPAQSVDRSPDGQLIAIGDYSPDNNIKILNPIDLSVIRTLPGHQLGTSARTMSVRFSPDGQFLASVGGDTQVKLWRVADGSLVRTFSYETAKLEVFSVAFSPDGQYLAAADRDNVSKVKIWRVSDGALLKTLTNPEFFSIPLHKVTWTPDGRYVVTIFETGNDPSRIRFWNFATGALAREYTGANVNTGIRALEFAPDGRTFAFSHGSRVILARNPFASASTAADFDGDKRSDPSVYRGGTWYLLESTNGFTAAQFGLPNDKLVPADYDGDGKTDLAVFRDGTWYRVNSRNNSFFAEQFGAAGDVPMTGDYDGDGKADQAIFRQGVWYFKQSASGAVRTVQFGLASDKPMTGDWDGDGKTDVAVFRQGTWYYLNSSNYQFSAIQFGLTSDIPMSGDYDDDGKTDLAVYRGGIWYLSLSGSNEFRVVQFGLPTDIPVSGDYDGDGKTDVAVFRGGTWHLLGSRTGYSAIEFGQSGDVPLMGASLP